MTHLGIAFISLFAKNLCHLSRELVHAAAKAGAFGGFPKRLGVYGSLSLHFRTAKRLLPRSERRHLTELAKILIVSADNDGARII